MIFYVPYRRYMISHLLYGFDCFLSVLYSWKRVILEILRTIEI